MSNDTKRNNVAARQSTVCVPRVLLPANADMRKWSVVACDQFTSDKAYWDKLYEYAGNAPSTLNMILPECYLGCCDEAEHGAGIEKTMREYLSSELFYEVNSFVSVSRKFASGKVRRGLVCAIDLTDYEYAAGNKALIRATEGTVEERLPPRVKIRERCPLELPHVMLLADDPKNILFSAVCGHEGKTLYDFELNAGGGRITGKEVADSQAVINAFAALKEDTKARCGEELLLLVGDGNHSLAAAKKCYEKAKAENDETAELKRYALCEIVNLYDSGIEFEPIHRALFGVNPESVAKELKELSAGFPLPAVMRGGGREYEYALPAEPISAVAFVQDFAAKYAEKTGCTVDYIHGENALNKLGDKPDCAAIPLPPIDKSGFTEYILRNGVLPQKTFSMGHAEEKRYYLEARRIGN